MPSFYGPDETITNLVGVTSKGAATSANSLPVVLASDQAAVPVSLPALPAGTNVIGHVIADSGSTTAITGTVAVSGTFWQSTQPVSAVALPLPTGAAQDATLTGGTAKAVARGGAKGATSAADLTSTAEGADHQALDVQIMHGGAAKDPTQVRALTSADVVSATQGTAAAGSGAWPVKVTDTSDALVRPGDAANNAIRVNVVAGGASGGTSSSFGSADPATGTAAGYSDGTNLREARVFDADSGAGTQYVLGAQLRKGASGGSVEAGTSSDPLRTDPTGTTTQPVSGTVTATQGTAAAGSGAWPIKVTDTADALVRPGDATNNAIRVNVVAGGASGGTSSSFGSADPATGTAAGYSDGTNLREARVFDGDSGAGTQYVLGALLKKPASGGTVDFGTSTDPVRTDPTGTTTQPVSGTVTGNQGTAAATAGAWPAKLTDGTNVAAVKAASTAAAATDPAAVVSLSPNSPIPAGTAVIGHVINDASSAVIGHVIADSGSTTAVTGTVAISAASLPLPTGAALDATLTGGTQKAQLTDSAGNANKEVSFSTAIVANVASTDAAAYRWASVQVVTQGGSSTITFQGSNDNTNWVSVVLVAASSFTGNGVVSTTTTGVWHGPLNCRYFRLVVTGIASGTTAGVCEFWTLPTMLQAFGATVSQNGTWTVQPGNTANTTAWKVDGSAVTQPVSGTVTSNQGTANATPWNENVAQVGGTATDTNSGVKSAGTLRVVLATDQPQLTNKLLVTPDANSAINVAQVGGAAVGTAASGVQKVGVVGNTGASVDSPVGAGTAPTNAIAAAALFNSSAPAPTAGQAMALQVDQAGNLRTMNGISLAALSAWNSGTALNATQTIFTNSGADSVLVHLVQTTTLTAGAITFEVSYDGANWVTIPAQCVLDPASTSFAQIAVPYTVQASTNKPFLIALNGAQALRIKLSTQITGTGSVTPNYALLNYDVVGSVIALSPTAANFNVTLGTGANTIGALSANQSVNVAQINGVTALMGNGTTGTGSQRVTIASDNTAFAVNATLQAGSSTVGNVGLTAITSGGATTYEAVAAGSTNAASIKGSAGKVMGWYCFNAAASTRYVKLYNVSGTPAPASDTVKWVIALPAGGAANMAFGEGLDFPTGIGIAMVTGISNTDNTGVTANDLVVSIAYK